MSPKDGKSDRGGKKKQSKKASRRRASERRPLYQLTADTLGKMLAKMAPGTFLPSEPALAKKLGVSRATLREAIRTFEERGQVIRRQGIGTYVSHLPPVIDTGLEVLESVPTLASRIDLEIEMAGLDVHERQPTDHEKNQFGIGDKDPVVEVSRVLATSERPVAYLVDVLPMGILPAEAFNDDFKGSVLDIFLQRRELSLGHSRTDLTAISAPANIARKLQVSRKEVLLVLEAWLYTDEGKVIDHSFSYFLPGVFKFHVVRRVGR
jgi:GntR family transcriptional regulator